MKKFSLENNKIVFLLLTFLFFVLIFLLNRLYPLYLDDWLYSLTWNGKLFGYKPHRVEGLLDILQTQYNLYNQWTGRVLLHGINQFLLMLNPYLKYLINTSIYIIYIYTMYKFCKFDNLVQNTLYLIIFCTSFLFLPHFLETTIWTTGTSNYLWGTLLLLLFIYPYYKYSESNDPLKSAYVFLWGLYGIIAGCTNENSVLSTICILSVYILYLKINKIKIPLWMFFGLLGLIIGASFMLLAPGNFERVKIYNHESTLSLLSTIRVGLKNIYHIYRNGVILFLSVFSVFLYLIAYYKRLINKHEQVIIIGLFLLAQLSILAMIGSIYFPLRATFFTTTIFIIIILKLLNIVFIKTKVIYKYIFAALLFVCYTNTYIYRYTVVDEFNKIMNRRIQFIENEKNKGNFDIVITEMIELPEEFKIDDISNDPTFWINENYKNYFMINSIRSDK